MAKTKDLNIHNFEAFWDKISEEEQASLIRESGSLGPDIAIQTVLKGIDSNYSEVRTQARETLKMIRSEILKRLKEPVDEHQRLNAEKDTARVCSRIFSGINPGISFEKQAFIFKTLLGFEGKGAHVAFKALCMRRISIAATEKIILMLPDSQRLDFIQEYLKATPELRLKFGTSFRQFVLSIKQNDAVVTFFAGLFDARADMDPFLYNLHPDLRDPEKIITGFVKSEFPGIRVKGLKALAMTTHKIPPGLLVEMLSTETDPGVRQTLYNIIENSALGTYPEVFDPVLRLLEKTNDKEAFHAVNALIVSGQLPLLEVLEIIKKKYPGPMGHIYKEISNLSKISFFFIQDMALNRSAYVKSNIEINLAAAFGIIKKRPERVVGMLINHINQSDDEIKKGVDGFIKKIKQLLAMEGKTFEEPFHVVAEKVEKLVPHQPEGILKSFFSSSGPAKKIEALKKDGNSEPVDFKGEPIINVDLSSLICRQQNVNFSNCIIKDSNFSNAGFSNACFKNSILYQADLGHASFTNVSFDGAVFIQVNAKAAVFKNCSFQGISIHDSNFDEAVMNGSFFIAATLSKSSFEKTDLSCSSFAYSGLRGVSFVHSNLDQVDFTGIQAQFCRFPTHVRIAML
ncbi:MAG: pentapeptide repeat-containing protein, partial [Desulfobacula sp.]